MVPYEGWSYVVVAFELDAISTSKTSMLEEKTGKFRLAVEFGASLSQKKLPDCLTHLIWPCCWSPPPL